MNHRERQSQIRTVSDNQEQAAGLKHKAVDEPKASHGDEV